MTKEELIIKIRQTLTENPDKCITPAELEDVLMNIVDNLGGATSSKALEITIDKPIASYLSVNFSVDDYSMIFTDNVGTIRVNYPISEGSSTRRVIIFRAIVFQESRKDYYGIETSVESSSTTIKKWALKINKTNTGYGAVIITAT